MNKYLIDRFRIHVQQLPWWWRVAYLVPDPVLHQGGFLEDVARFAKGQDKAFNQVVENHVAAFLEHGTMPPAAITAPILNVAEDIKAGREVTLRGGDYIALQNFVRSQAHK